MKKILIAEDNLDTRELLATLLYLEGYIVLTADDGDEALGVAKTERPDLLVTDLSMPHKNGIDLIKALRAQADFQALPILVLTALGKDSADDAIRAGANEALHKPVDYDSLLKRIQFFLS
ncbi:MAG TPA: response regulator [Blastocatellia bacterium]|nr:response regulator [Blastocatellia bacterium]